MIGTVLDKYEILQKIGEGGMASVYRGRHVTLGREVAIKILHPHLSSAERNRQRFAREARAIEHLDHDNILRIFDYSGAETRDCYIVTEFVDGRTLHDLLGDHGALPSEVVAQIGMRLADALEYAHGLGIIHRDLKPENVMLRRDGTVKLMDFGIARFLDEMHLTVTGALVGSPAYMSPEQAMERVLDSRSDLFSLGTLLFHLVTGQLPFSGNNPSIVLRNIIEGKRPGVADLTPEVSAPLADLIHALLQTDPDDRPRTAGMVRDRLRLVLEEVEIDPDDAEWSLQTWLVDPVGFQERLGPRLREVLLRKGKERLEARDHLGALQLFNRLLSLDEDNDEVLALVQGMHGAHEAARRPSTWWAGGLGLLAVAGLLTWLLWPSPVPTDAPTPTPTPTVVLPDDTPPTDASAGPPTGDAAPDGSATDPDTDAVAPADGGVDAATTDDPATTDGSEAPDGAARPAGLEGIVDNGPQQDSTGRKLVRLPRPPVPRQVDQAARTADAAGAAGGTASGSGDEPGFVTIYVPGSWGHIYIDGNYKGRTGQRREPIEVSPGTHRLTVKNDLALPHEETFTLGPGETLQITTPALQRKPATVLLADSVDGSCHLIVDGVDRGTVEGLGRQLALQAPEERHALQLSCADGTSEHAVGPLMAGETVRIP